MTPAGGSGVSEAEVLAIVYAKVNVRGVFAGLVKPAEFTELRERLRVAALAVRDQFHDRAAAREWIDEWLDKKLS